MLIKNNNFKNANNQFQKRKFTLIKEILYLLKILKNNGNNLKY
jgi:hypothetical protein